MRNTGPRRGGLSKQGTDDIGVSLLRINASRVVAYVPQYDEEYFDVFYGIDPLAWASCGFAIVYFGAALKNAAQKYNKPVGQAPPKVGGFVGKEVENREPSYKA
ncbi:unnamed protein product [Effrenium voratum]|nr:unnamed protein product [Effrenium voratum]